MLRIVESLEIIGHFTTMHTHTERQTYNRRLTLAKDALPPQETELSALAAVSPSVLESVYKIEEEQKRIRILKDEIEGARKHK